MRMYQRLGIMTFGLCSLIAGIGTALSTTASAIPAPRHTTALTCFKSGEQISGINKICYYNCAGSSAAITVSIASLCPLTIDR